MPWRDQTAVRYRVRPTIRQVQRLLAPRLCDGGTVRKDDLCQQQALTPEGTLLHPGDIVAQTREVMTHIRLALEVAGADLQDVVKINRWYAGHGSVDDFEPAALACAANFAEPGPAATGIPIPRHAREGQMIRIEVVAMRGEDGNRLPRRSVGQTASGIGQWSFPIGMNSNATT